MCCFRIVGAKFQKRSKILYRLLPPAQIFEDIGETEVRIGVIRF